MRHGLCIFPFAVLAPLVALLFVDEFADATLAHMSLVLLLNTVLLTLGVVFRAERRVPFVCDPIVLTCAFLFQFFVLAPVFLHIWGGLPTLVFFTPPRPETVVLAQVAFFLMMGFCLLAYRLNLGVALADLIPDFRSTRRKPSGRWLEAMLLLACLAAAVYWIQLQGGLLARLSASYGERYNPPVLSIFHRALVVVTLLITWRIVDSDRRRRADWVLLGSTLAFDAVFFGLLLGVRKYLLFIFFGILTIWLLRRGMRGLPKLRMAAALIVLLVFFSVWGAVRSRPLTVLMGQSSDITYAKKELHMGYVSALTAPFGAACKVMEIFPHHEPFKYGGTLTIVFLGFIPRAVWPEKPVGLGKEITRYYEGPMYKHTSGLSVGPSILGSFWVNFGWPGIILGGMSLGLVCRTVTAYAVKGMRNGLQMQASRTLILAVFVAGLGEVRADLAALLVTYAMMFVPLFVALTFFRFDHRGTQPSSA